MSVPARPTSAVVLDVHHRETTGAHAYGVLAVRDAPAQCPGQLRRAAEAAHPDQARVHHACSPSVIANVACCTVTRMFTSGSLSAIVGGVGFNHHLLHHSDASISN